MSPSMLNRIERLRIPARPLLLISIVAAGLSLIAVAHGESSSATGNSKQSTVQQKITKEKQPKQKRRPSAANSFNRLLKKPLAPSNAPPSEDGIHDPANAGTHHLQWPSEAFQDLPKSGDGNKVDWVKSLHEGLITPFVSLEEPETEPFIMDLVIVREVKGSMPDVVYPHKEHTEWLDCTNCHDEIFTPEKGKNQISMAAILLGRKCGICHGKVAFPVSDCRRCHSKPKTDEQLRALAKKSAWQGLTAGKAKQ